MDARSFQNTIEECDGRHRLTYFDVTDSTNTRALDAIGRGTARDGDLFIAGQQTAGRGSDGKTWESGEPVGLWMSMVFVEPLRTTLLSLLPAVALATILRRKFGIAAHLKWPNDVLVGTGETTRKIAGILVESVPVSDAGRAWVVGIGVNVRQTSFAGPLATRATSIRMQSGSDVDVADVFKSLIDEMDRLCENKDNLIELWTELSRMPGRSIRLSRDGSEAMVRVEGLNSEGHLIVAHSNGMRETLAGITGIDIDARY